MKKELCEGAIIMWKFRGESSLIDIVLSPNKEKELCIYLSPAGKVETIDHIPRGDNQIDIIE